MISWDDFINTRRIEFYNIADQTKVPTAIVCPKCGKIVYRDDSRVYASMPPKQRYFCDKCGWSDFA